MGRCFWKFSIYAIYYKNYAIDYDKNDEIELKKTKIHLLQLQLFKKIGWKKSKPCFIKINLKKDIPKKYLNSSARKSRTKKFRFFKKYIENFDELNLINNQKVAIIIPDKDIIPNSQNLSPAFMIFDNYEKSSMEQVTKICSCSLFIKRKF